MSRQRLDLLVVERGYASSRERARRLIMAGEVRVAGQVVDKPGALVDVEAALDVHLAEISFVSRGGTKLAAAIETFGIDVGDAVVIDVGASTGGFTDCVLQRGAKLVIAVDVGYGQFDWRLRQDSRVVLRERCNIRHLRVDELPAVPTIAVVDVSFISLRLVLPKLVEIIPPGGAILVLVKPQFEVGRGHVGKGGVVRDPALRAAAVHGVRAAGEAMGLQYVGECESPIPGPKGNREVFLYFRRPASEPSRGPADPCERPDRARAR